MRSRQEAGDPHRAQGVELGGVFVFAAVLRLFFVRKVLADFAMLSPGDRAALSVGYLTADSHEYIRLASLLLDGRFADALSPVRPPGYPAFLAMLQLQPVAVLVTQAVLLALIPVWAMLLVRLFTGHRLLALLAGVVSCLSPTGIGLGGLYMADSIFAPLFALAFWALVYGAVHRSPRWLLVSSFVGAGANLVKPILLLWPLVSVVVFLLVTPGLADARPGLRAWVASAAGHWKSALILGLPPLLVSLALATANQARNGQFTVSTIGSDAARTYLGAQVEAWSAAGRRPTNRAISEVQGPLRDRLRLLPESEKAGAYVSESLEIFRRYPVLTSSCFLENAYDNARSSWGYFAQQVPLLAEGRVRRVEQVVWLDLQIRTGTIWVVLLAPILAWLLQRVAPSGEGRQIVGALAAMSMTVVYFALCSGMTFWVGSRVVYPTEFLSIACVAVLAWLLVCGRDRPPNRMSQES